MEPISNAKQVWGKLLTRLRENGDTALFVSCGEINDVEIEGTTLIIKTDKKYLAELIDTDQNIHSLKRALRFLGYDLDIKVQVLESKSETAEKDIEFLKGKLGNFLKID